MAAPRPRDDPVTRAVFPFRLNRSRIKKTVLAASFGFRIILPARPGQVSPPGPHNGWPRAPRSKENTTGRICCRGGTQTPREPAAKQSQRIFIFWHNNEEEVCV